MAQAVVLVAMALTSWLVVSAVGPGIFHDHLQRTGVGHTPVESDHVEQAFASATVLALAVALVTATVLALAVSWYISRRVQRSIAHVVRSADEVAAGDYRSRLPNPGLGGEFDQLALAFNTLADRLDAVESTRRRMLADLAHEMRTPLATLDAHLEALEDGMRQLDESTFAVLRSSTLRLGRLARDIGAVSGAQEGKLEIHREMTAPRRLVATACEAFADRFHAKGVILRADVSTERPVRVDPARMGQVLTNLLDNALRHTGAGGVVTMSCRTLDRWVEFQVRDTGEGIEPRHLPHLFDRFYRADPARNRSGGGSGIGLTIAKALVEGHGGSIAAASAGPGHGSTFTVRIPASAPN